MRGAFSCRNFNGVSGNFEVENGVVFVGPNGSGKSSRLKAILLAILGHIPGGAKKPSDLMAYATGPKMAVGLAIPFLRIDRYFKGDTTSAQTKLVVGPDFSEDATQKEMQEFIERELGTIYAVDLGSFVNLNQNKQREFILALCATEKEAPVRQVKKALFNAKLSADHEIFKAIEDSLPQEEREGLGQVLSHFISSLRSKQSELQNAVKGAQATAKKLTEERRDLNTSAASIAQTKEELEKLQSELETVAAEKARIETGSSATEVLEAEVAKIEAAMAKYTKDLPPGFAIELAQELEAGLRAELEDLPKRVEEAKAGLEELAKKRQALDQETDQARADLDEAKSEALVSESRVTNAQRRADVLQEGKCPLGLECNHDAKAFREATEEALKAVGYFSGKHKKAVDQSSSLTALLGMLLERERDIKVNDASLRETIDQLGVRELKVEGELEILERYTELHNQREEVKARASQTSTPAGLDELVEKETGLRTRVEELKKALEEQEILKANEIQFAKSMEDRDALESNLEIVKTALEALGPKGLQGEAAKTASGPFLNALNMVLRKFDLKAFIETENAKGKPIFRWGLVHDGHGPRVYDVLPTSYKAIMGAAVSLAFFLLKASPKSILIMDDLEHLDGVNRRKFLKVVSDFLSGNSCKSGDRPLLDLFVGASTESTGLDPKKDRWVKEERLKKEAK